MKDHSPILKRNLTGCVAAVLLILFDQFTKMLAVAHLKNQPSNVLIDGVFELRYLENRGSAFGMMQNKLIILIPVTVVVTLLILYLFFKKLPATRHFFWLNAVAVLFFPGPDTFEEFFAADFVAGLAFFGQLLFDLYLGSDTGMVGARNPGDVVAFHALEADQNILQGVVQSMAHVELTRNVRRRHDDAEGFLALIRLLMEVAVLFPKIVPRHFHVIRCIRAQLFFIPFHDDSLQNKKEHSLA